MCSIFMCTPVLCDYVHYRNRWWVPIAIRCRDCALLGHYWMAFIFVFSHCVILSSFFTSLLSRVFCYTVICHSRKFTKLVFLLGSGLYFELQVEQSSDCLFIDLLLVGNCTIIINLWFWYFFVKQLFSYRLMK